MTRWNKWCLYVAWLASFALLRTLSVGESDTWGYAAWIAIGGAAILSLKSTKEEA